MRDAAVHTCADACAAAFPETAQKGLVLLLTELEFFVLLKVLASGWVLAGFRKPTGSSGGTRNSPAIRIEPPPVVHSIVRGCT